MDYKELVLLTEERIKHLTYSEMMSAMESLEDNHLIRNELMCAIHEGTDLERIGSIFLAALYHYHQTDVRLNNDFG